MRAFADFVLQKTAGVQEAVVHAQPGPAHELWSYSPALMRRWCTTAGSGRWSLVHQLTIGPGLLASDLEVAAGQRCIVMSRPRG